MAYMAKWYLKPFYTNFRQGSACCKVERFSYKYPEQYWRVMEARFKLIL